MIRKFRKEDANACGKIITDCINKGKYVPKSAREHIIKISSPNELIKNMKKRNYFVYIKNKKVMAIGALDKNEVKTMYVIPKSHGQGIGSLILKRIIKQAKKEKRKKLHLYTHPKAVEFYMKNGFEIKKEFTDRGNKIIYMEKKLK